MIRNILIFIVLTGCTINNGFCQKPEKVYGFARQNHDCEWYKTQANLWKTETEKNPQNAMAWVYWYRSVRYSLMTCGADLKSASCCSRPLLDSIMIKMGKILPNSYEYNYLMYYNGMSNPEMAKYLMKALEIAPDRPEIMSDLVTYYDIQCNQAKVDEYCKKWYACNELSPGILAWNYNMMVSLDKDAIIFLGGDMDTYPKMILQSTKNFRKDVKILNVYLLLNESFRNGKLKEMRIPTFEQKPEKFKDRSSFQKAIISHIVKNAGSRPVYFALSLPEECYQEYKDSIYNEGLVYKYSKERYDNIAVSKKNYEKLFLLDYIREQFTDDISQNIVNLSNLNYLAAFIPLYEHYKLSGDFQKQKELGELMLTIARDSGRHDYIDYIQSVVKE